SRHASAHRLFEVSEWEEQQKRLKQRLQTGETNTTYSYDEIKAKTEELLKVNRCLFYFSSKKPTSV
ncbi:unnamed protein product, partial [Rotaria socialis]